jgi:hypothetical protein
MSAKRDGTMAPSMAHLAWMSWLFVADKQIALREIARILKPGGRFVGTSWELRADSAALHAPAFYDYPGAFKDAGFEIEILRRRPEIGGA